MPRDARSNRWLRLATAVVVGALLTVALAELAAPPREQLDLWPGAAIRRARDAPERQLAYALNAATTGAVLAAGIWLMWMILREDRRR